MRKNRRLGVVKVYYHPDTQRYESLLEIPEGTDESEHRLLLTLGKAVKMKLQTINDAMKAYTAQQQLDQKAPEAIVEPEKPRNRPFYRPHKSVAPPAQQTH